MDAENNSIILNCAVGPRISKDSEVKPQTQVGIIKIYKDGTEEYKDVIR